MARSFRISVVLGFLMAAVLPASAIAAGWEAHLAVMTKSAKCRGAIFGLDATQWAGQNARLAESDNLKALINALNKQTPFPGTTLYGIHFATTHMDAHSITLKHGADGAVFIKTSKALSMCLFNEKDVTPAAALTATQQLATHLVSIGF